MKKEIIIRTSPNFSPFNTTTYDYADKDINTLGSKEVFESIVIENGKVASLCRLQSNDPIKHINSIIIRKEMHIKPGEVLSNFREAKISELEESIEILDKFKTEHNVNSVDYVDKLNNIKNELVRLKRENVLDKILDNE